MTNSRRATPTRSRPSSAQQISRPREEWGTSWSRNTPPTPLTIHTPASQSAMATTTTRSSSRPHRHLESATVCRTRHRSLPRHTPIASSSPQPAPHIAAKTWSSARSRTMTNQSPASRLLYIPSLLSFSSCSPFNFSSLILLSFAPVLVLFFFLFLFA